MRVDDELWDVCCACVFFFKQKTAYEMRISDWSSDVCSSDLGQVTLPWLELHALTNWDSANSMRWRSASRRRTSASRAAARSADSWQWVPSSSLSNCATSSRLKPKR